MRTRASSDPTIGTGLGRMSRPSGPGGERGVAGTVNECRGNFSAGPAAMPRAVLDRIGDELLDWRGTGVSVMETSHRSAAFADCAAEVEADLRALLGVPEDYAVLFMQGGASLQFALTVMNLAGEGDVAFADTGYWSRKAIATARGLVPLHVVCETGRGDSAEGGGRVIPSPERWSIPPKASYLHLCDNETIEGVAFDEATLDTLAEIAPGLPIVADMSSSILSRPIDVSRYALIYAGAQKNIGPAGITVAIASPEAMERSRRAADLPGAFSYAATAAAGSMLNTPPTFAWYAAGLVFEWLAELGGLAVMAERNRAQAARVYAAVDGLAPFGNDVDPRFRSIMNVPFRVEGGEDGTAAFLARCEAAGLIGLRGHKSVGGCRASLYNALPDAAVDALVEAMEAFAAER